MATLSFLLRATSSRLLSISCCVFFSFLSSVCVCLLFSCCRLYWRWLYGPFFLLAFRNAVVFFPSAVRRRSDDLLRRSIVVTRRRTFSLSLCLSLFALFLSSFNQCVCTVCLGAIRFSFHVRVPELTQENNSNNNRSKTKKRTKKQKTNNARRVYQIYLLPRPPFGVYMFYDVILFGCCLCFLRRFVCRSSFVFVFFLFFFVECVCVCKDETKTEKILLACPTFICRCDNFSSLP